MSRTFSLISYHSKIPMSKKRKTEEKTFKANSPWSAAKKIASYICKTQIIDKCEMVIELIETTRGSSHMIYAYEVYYHLQHETVEHNGKKVTVIARKLHANELEDPVEIGNCKIDCRNTSKTETPCKNKNALFLNKREVDEYCDIKRSANRFANFDNMTRKDKIMREKFLDEGYPQRNSQSPKKTSSSHVKFSEKVTFSPKNSKRNQVPIIFNGREEVINIINTGGNIMKYLGSQNIECPLIGSKIKLVRPLGEGVSEATVWLVEVEGMGERKYAAKVFANNIFAQSSEKSETLEEIAKYEEKEYGVPAEITVHINGGKKISFTKQEKNILLQVVYIKNQRKRYLSK